ncbi:hypothetical protein HMPREF3182_00226 [Megasphaera hutchinsoni]|uniref:Uncharacterized protein n=1 Tax=Megasphaera hutchinsoni TaxID=1588748 RepID=A0A134CKL9_9FIRM|nr:hypothetical protein HMPREF3182_00226 [Megasphaera hutchinsoni]
MSKYIAMKSIKKLINIVGKLFLICKNETWYKTEEKIILSI